MEEKFLWQDPNHGILGRVKEPGRIPHKEDLMEKDEKLVKAHDKGEATDSQGQKEQAQQGSAKEREIAFFDDPRVKDQGRRETKDKDSLGSVKELFDRLKMMKPSLGGGKVWHGKTAAKGIGQIVHENPKIAGKSGRW